MKMGIKFPKIDENGDKNHQNRLKWGQKSPKCTKMGTKIPKMSENGDKNHPNRLK